MSTQKQSMQEAFLICLWACLGVITSLLSILLDFMYKCKDQLLVLVQNLQIGNQVKDDVSTTFHSNIQPRHESEECTAHVVGSNTLHIKSSATKITHTLQYSTGQKSKWYAVVVGHQPGIYQTWDECNRQVWGYSGCKFKSFKTKEEALQYYHRGLWSLRK